ncbi:MAG: hypothetical protein VYC17_02030 [Nitrospinota bacterium]|nr:hypothetical protein [Nitrospinota bacterium]
MFIKSITLSIVAFTMVIGQTGLTASAETKCEPLEKKPVKIDAWISKKFKKDKRAIKKEMSDLEHIKVRLRVFPMKDPAKIMAIGGCVPVNIAQHALRQAMKYTAGVEALINQKFIFPHWIGIGTMNFDEYSQQVVSEDQVKALMDTSLNTEEFQGLYRNFAKMKEEVKGFGMQVPNPRKMND